VIRVLRALPLLLLPALRTGCGTEKAGAGADTGTGTSAGTPTASASPAPSPATSAEIASRARALGFDPDLVYVIDPPGFTLAQQSVGVSDVGLSVSYTSPKNGAVINLRVEPGTMTDANCTTQAVTTEHMTCVRDGKAWYRTGGGDAEYVTAAKGHLVHVAAEQGKVSREVLRESARSLRRPYKSELAEILPSRQFNTGVETGG
jgi:hypothetical protein